MNVYFVVLSPLVSVSLRGSPVCGMVNWGIITIVGVFFRSSSSAPCWKQGFLQSGVRWLRVLLSQTQKIPKDEDFTASLGRQFQPLTFSLRRCGKGFAVYFAEFGFCCWLGCVIFNFCMRCRLIEHTKPVHFRSRAFNSCPLRLLNCF